MQTTKTPGLKHTVTLHASVPAPALCPQLVSRAAICFSPVSPAEGSPCSQGSAPRSTAVSPRPAARPRSAHPRKRRLLRCDPAHEGMPNPADSHGDRDTSSSTRGRPPLSTAPPRPPELLPLYVVAEAERHSAFSALCFLCFLPIAEPTPPTAGSFLPGSTRGGRVLPLPFLRRKIPVKGKEAELLSLARRFEKRR